MKRFPWTLLIIGALGFLFRNQIGDLIKKITKKKDETTPPVV